MRSPAPKQAESEFDELLGQLTDELAMTPASESAVSLVPDLEPPKVHVEATARMAAEAAAAAGVLQPVASKPDNTVVKIVGIIAASLTVVSVAALVMFGQAKPAAEPAPVVADVAVAQAEQQDDAERRAEREAHARAIQAERDAERAEHARIEAAHLAAKVAAQAESKPKPRPKPRPKIPPKGDLGGDFDEL